MWTTWKHDDRELPRPLSFEHKVDIFYHRLLGWQLHVADLVSNGGKPLAKDGRQLEAVRTIPHSGFAVLHICLSYFETIGQYQRINPRTKKAGEFFREGVRAVFPELRKERQANVDTFLDMLYEDARCGLYHNSTTRPGICLGQPGNNVAMKFSSARGQLVIDPHVLPRTLKAHLESYRNRLLDPQNGDLRRNFERQFNRDNGVEST